MLLWNPKWNLFCHHEWLLDIALDFKIKNFSNRKIDKNLEMNNKCCTLLWVQYCTIASCLYRGSYYGGGGGGCYFEGCSKINLSNHDRLCFNEIVHYVKVFLHPFVQERGVSHPCLKFPVIYNNKNNHRNLNRVILINLCIILYQI